MKIQLNTKKCSDCGVCKLACSIENFKQVASAMALLNIKGLFPTPGTYEIHFCDQCGYCADACPVDAIEFENDCYRINEEDCIACHECITACPKSVMIIKQENDMPAKCILCGECARVCPREAIVIKDEETAREAI